MSVSSLPMATSRAGIGLPLKSFPDAVWMELSLDAPPAHKRFSTWTLSAAPLVRLVRETLGQTLSAGPLAGHCPQNTHCSQQFSTGHYLSYLWLDIVCSTLGWTVSAEPLPCPQKKSTWTLSVVPLARHYSQPPCPQKLLTWTLSVVPLARHHPWYLWLDIVCRTPLPTHRDFSHWTSPLR